MRTDTISNASIIGKNIRPHHNDTFCDGSCRRMEHRDKKAVSNYKWNNNKTKGKKKVKVNDTERKKR